MFPLRSGPSSARITILGRGPVRKIEKKKLKLKFLSQEEFIQGGWAMNEPVEVEHRRLTWGDRIEGEEVRCFWLGISWNASLYC